MSDRDAFQLLVAVDGSGPARAALGWSTSFLHGVEGPAAMEVFTVWVPTEKIGMDGFGLIDPSGYPQESEALLRGLLAESGSPLEVQTLVGSGRPVESIVLAAFGHDLLVIGTRAAGPVRQALVGSMSQAVVGRVTCPVAVIPETYPDPGGLTIVAWDGTRGAIGALRWALTHRQVDKILVVFVSQGAACGDEGETIRDDISDVFGGEIAQLLEIEVRFGTVSERLLAASPEATEIVIGDRAKFGPNGSIWGSVTSHLLSNTTLPVVVVPAEGDEHAST